MISIAEIASFVQRNDIIFAMVVIVGTAIGVKSSDLMLKKMLNLAKRTKTDLDELIIKSVRIPILIGLTILGIWIGLTQIVFLKSYSDLLNDMLSVAWLLLVALMAIRVVDVVSIVSTKVWFRQSKASVQSFVTPLSRLGKGLIAFLIGLAAVAIIFGMDVSQLIFGGGLFGLAIALALQPVLSDIFSGLSIVSQGSFRVGDKVILNSGEIAKITEIRLQNTILQDMTAGNYYYSVSNTDLSKQKVTILDGGVLHVPILFKIDYNDLERASHIAMKVGKETDSLASAPAVNIVGLGNGGKAKLELSLWINDAGKRSQVITQTSSKLVSELMKERIQIG
jgi:MscS family membrane protein